MHAVHDEPVHDEPESIHAADGVEIEMDGRRLVSFAGCDSLGLARHPEVVEAAREALSRCGLSASASRTTTGTWDEHLRLEATLAAYMETADAVVLPSGWLACQSLTRALADRSRGLLVDEGAHPSVHDAALLSGVTVTAYKRFDANDARRRAQDLVGGRPILTTCSVDLARGALAPLADLARVAADLAGSLVIDDAHGVGVLGGRGRGAAEHVGAAGPHVHVAGTLSKAFGTHGGFVAGSRRTCDAVRARAPAYAAATPLPPALAAAARRAVELATDGELRTRLQRRCKNLAERFRGLGLAAPAEPLPWMAVHCTDGARLRRLSAALRGAGLLVPYVRYHGAPPQGYLRVAVSAAHTPAHLAALADALAREL